MLLPRIKCTMRLAKREQSPTAPRRFHIQPAPPSATLPREVFEATSSLLVHPASPSFSILICGNPHPRPAKTPSCPPLIWPWLSLQARLFHSKMRLICPLTRSVPPIRAKPCQILLRRRTHLLAAGGMTQRSIQHC